MQPRFLKITLIFEFAKGSGLGQEKIKTFDSFGKKFIFLSSIFSLLIFF